MEKYVAKFKPEKYTGTMLGKIKYIAVCIILLLILSISSLVSQKEFQTINPVTGSIGLFRVKALNEPTVQIQKAPHLIYISKSSDLNNFMRKNGWEPDKSNPPHYYFKNNTGKSCDVTVSKSFYNYQIWSIK